ncbi:MAG: hypothetical protein ACKOOE_06300 [Micrococcales bacterium]
MTASNEPIKVVFLTFYFEAWDALADIHSKMVADDRFETKVVSIPRRFSKDEPFGKEEQVSAFLDSLGVPHDRFNFDDSSVGLQRLREYQPDYVFINYPWQRNYQPGYRVDELAKFTKVCYVPYYSLALVNEPGEVGVTPYLFTQRSNQLASLVFTQDPNTLDAYSKTQRGNSYVHLTGTPKLDALVRKSNAGGAWPLGERGNRRMVWAPHHSFSNSWLNFGMFPQIFQDMLAFAEENQNLDIVMRPHPIMFGTLVERDVIPQEVLTEWIDSWNSLPNTAIDHNGDIASIFAATDFFVTDGISFLGEYPIATGKPAIFFDKPEHWPWSPIGGLASAANIHVRDFDAFLEVFEAISQNGLPDYAAEIDILRDAAQPYPGQAAEKIINVILDDFGSKTPLVDISSITETAWENRPGTEAPWD